MKQFNIKLKNGNTFNFPIEGLKNLFDSFEGKDPVESSHRIAKAFNDICNEIAKTDPKLSIQITNVAQLVFGGSEIIVGK